MREASCPALSCLFHLSPLIHTPPPQEQVDNFTTVPNFREANYEGWRDYLEKVWRDPGNITEKSILHLESSGSRTVEQEYNIFLQVVHRGKEIHIPSKQYRTKKSDPRWLNNRLKYTLGKNKGIYRRIKREFQLYFNVIYTVKVYIYENSYCLLILYTLYNNVCGNNKNRTINKRDVQHWKL